MARQRPGRVVNEIFLTASFSPNDTRRFSTVSSGVAAATGRRGLLGSGLLSGGLLSGGDFSHRASSFQPVFEAFGPVR